MHLADSEYAAKLGSTVAVCVVEQFQSNVIIEQWRELNSSIT